MNRTLYYSILVSAILTAQGCSEADVLGSSSMNISIQCEEGYHEYARQCEPDSLEHCGEHRINCLDIPGWISGSCTNQTCVIAECETGFHISDGHCALDTDECCGESCTECPPQQLCSLGKCMDRCADSETFCDPFCFDLKSSRYHCGSCDHNCMDELPANGKMMRCEDSQCVLITCNPGYYLDNGQCIAIPGVDPVTVECELNQKQACYDGGDTKYLGIGDCRSGYYPCVQDAKGNRRWDTSKCLDMVVPSYNFTCTSPTSDADCNGIPDYQQDEDGDGYTVCNLNGTTGDCCDNPNMCGTSQTEYVHPGQPGDCYGNTIDDNCNGLVDESPEIACSIGFAECGLYNETCGAYLSLNYPSSQSSINTFPSEKALILAKAMDICLNPIDSASTEPGILEYSVSQAGSSYPVNARQVNIKSSMKDVNGTPLIKPQNGENFLILSSGGADDVYGDSFDGDEHYSIDGEIPEVYLNAHGGKLQSHPMCSEGSEDINDSVHLHLKLRAPLSANGFRFDFRFFSNEYPQYVCTAFNDFFLALLTDESGKPLVDTDNDGSLDDEDGNISFDSKGNPISVNNSLFTTCAEPSCSMGLGSECPASMTCSNNKCGSCPDGTADLFAYTPDPYLGDDSTGRGGGTAWLTTSVPIQPGQVFNLDFYIWDTGDSAYDSSIILDNFRWTCSTQQIGTGYAEPNK